MSGSTQATGTNGISRTLSSPANLTICFWFKINGYDKAGFDSIVSIENALGGTNFRGAGIQQDSAGAGTADLHEGWWFSGQGPSSGFTPTLVNDTGVWHFGCIVWSGTALTFYYGTETGALGSQALTSNFSSTAATIVYLGTDSSTENANVSFRGVRLFLESRNSTQVTAERDSTTFAPADATNLDSYLPIVNGTSPNVATTGTNWTAIGTWADDASNPSFGSAVAASVGYSGINRRAPGFPPRAPLPGVPRLGVGLLQAPQVASPSAGAAAAALSTFASAAVGLLTFSATGSSAASPFSADATGAEVAAASTPAMATPQPMGLGLARGGIKLPAPPIPQLGVGLLRADPFAGFTASGSSAASPFASSASGALAFAATGSAAASPFGSDATATEAFTGTASAAAAPVASSASGLETFAATGSAACSPFASSASGVEAFAATG